MVKRAILSVLALGALAACGGGSSTSSAGSFSTTVPATTPLGQLSSAQLTTLCSDLNRYGMTLASNPTFKQGQCKLAGITAAAFAAGLGAATTDAQLQMACSMTYTQCLNAPPQTTTGGSCTTAPAASCTATVAQYTACLNDSVTVGEAALAMLPACNTITAASLSSSTGGTGGGNPPASCTTFSAACPDTGSLPDPTSASL
jgi:hypothetical protein